MYEDAHLEEEYELRTEIEEAIMFSDEACDWCGEINCVCDAIYENELSYLEEEEG